tara:strand:- start:2771 stop:3946 length:1176 start_codon:yes stop_codon:yes gene_type:complete
MSAGTFFKTFTSSDRTTTRTLLHEAIPITGTLVSGTYNAAADSDLETREANIKTYSHGMFQSVFDYPHLSSSANHIFDITYGFHSASSLSGSTVPQVAKKINIYNQMAQTLVGYDVEGNIRKFDQDGDLLATAQTKMNSVIFFNFSRLLVKDEIKKGSFSMDFCVDATYPHVDTLKVRIADTGAATSYKVNSPAGEYGILSASNLAGTPLAANSPVDHDASAVGLVFYQAGIVALTSSLFLGVQTTGSSTPLIPAGLLASATHPKMRTTSGNDTDDSTINHLITGSTLNKLADSIRHRISNVQFNNTTELNSSIYFCRANHNEFNYSSNPTYLNGSKIQVKGNDITAPPKAYVTTVGLYSADNELLAVAKLSEPLRKDPTNELTLRVRLDY